jgi:sulfite reductase (NADPH) hemoprotein beta-component
MSGCINSAATTTAATSASWAWTRTARSGTRSRWAAPTARSCRAPPLAGKVVGPSFTAAEVPDVIEAVLDTYRALRQPGELFIDALRRIGHDPFKQAPPTRRAMPSAEEAVH